MNKMKNLLLMVLLLWGVTSYAQLSDPLSWKSSIEKINDTDYRITLNGAIEQGWAIYDMKSHKRGPNPTVLVMDLPEGVVLKGEPVVVSPVKTAFDDIFAMDIGKIYKEAVIEQVITVNTNEAMVTGYIEWQACNDVTCLAPTQFDFRFNVEGVAPAGSTDDVIKPTKLVAATKVAEVAGAEVTGSTVEGDLDRPQSSMWAIIIEAILYGFAALLTPCVFPMVPMTVSFFMKGNGSKAKGRMMAALYGLSIVALYTVPITLIIGISFIFGGDAVTVSIFNWIATHWVTNVLFFVIFVVFAISFFGAFEIVMPSWLVNKSDSKSDKGGILGVFFMALTLVLVSFSCTGPIVGSILVQSTQGAIWQPILTMLVFSSAFALPFTLFAFFPSLLKTLPKSGGWLNSVKVVLGFVELALALKFLSTADQTYHWDLLDRELYIALWIVIFTLLGFYLLGKIRFAHDTPEPYLKVKKLFFAILTFSFVVYLIPGMFGAPLKALSGYLPPMHTLDFDLSKGRVSDKSASDMPVVKYADFLHLPHGIKGFFDFEQGAAYAKSVGKPMLLDFTGHGCVNCRKMEADVWSDPQVLDILKNQYVVVGLYVDDKKTLPESDWVTSSNGKVLKTLGQINAKFQIDRFNINAQPYYVLMDNNDSVLVTPRSYDLSVSGFVEFLKSGVTAYNKTKK